MCGYTYTRVCIYIHISCTCMWAFTVWKHKISSHHGLASQTLEVTTLAWKQSIWFTAQIMLLVSPRIDCAFGKTENLNFDFSDLQLRLVIGAIWQDCEKINWHNSWKMLDRGLDQKILWLKVPEIKSTSTIKYMYIDIEMLYIKLHMYIGISAGICVYTHTHKDLYSKGNKDLNSHPQ
jgi:hypothetical protein